MRFTKTIHQLHTKLVQRLELNRGQLAHQLDKDLLKSNQQISGGTERILKGTTCPKLNEYFRENVLLCNS